jgi:hypothetical protein
MKPPQLAWVGQRYRPRARFHQPSLEEKERDMQKVNLEAKLALFSEHWSPKVVGELNGQHVRLVKVLGETLDWNPSGRGLLEDLEKRTYFDH